MMRSALLYLTLMGVAHGADFHLTPTGSGQLNGASWDHAFDQQSLASVVNERMQPGDRLLVGGGMYKDATLTITKGGSRGAPKSIVGVDRGEGLPMLVGTWSAGQPEKGATALHLAARVSHVSVQGLRIRGYVFGVYAPAVKEGPARTQLEFSDVDMEQFRHGFYVSDCDDVRLTGCDLKRYTKHAFRFEQGCDRVKLARCTADCSEGDAEWEKMTELFPFGFFVNSAGAPNTAFEFEDCLARNHLMPLQKASYKNGDGFVVEENAKDVAFARCRAIRNQDGGFDLKVRDVRLTDCVAIRNSRNFRIWTTATLTNCLAGWGATGLWCNGGPVEVKRSTFHELSREAVLMDDAASHPVTLSECLISRSGKTHSTTAHGDVVVRATVSIADAQSADAPKFLHPDPGWNGLGDAMNSSAFPGKGYRSDPEQKIR